MPSLRCRRSLLGEMAGKSSPASATAASSQSSDTESELMSLNKSGGVKRKCHSSDVEDSPAKRTRSQSVRVTLEDQTNSPEKVPVKSFYSGSKGSYLTPLERKDIRQRRASLESTSTKSTQDIYELISPTEDEEKQKQPSKRQQTAAKKKNSKKPSSNDKTTKNKSPNTSFGNVSIARRESEVPTADKDNSEAKTEKKFFRHRLSPGKRLSSRSPQVVIRKGFKLNFQKAGKLSDVKKPGGILVNSPANDSEQKSSSSDRPSVATVSSAKVKGPDRSRGVNSTPVMKAIINKFSQDLFSDVSSISSSVIESPLKTSQDLFSDNSDMASWFEYNDATENSSQSKVNGNKGRFSDSACHSESVEHPSDSDSAKADSVLLLSEMSSVKSATPQSTPSKLYSIFASKSTPKKGRMGSLGSVSPSSSTGSPYSDKMKSTRSSSKHLLDSLVGKDGKEQMVLDFGQKLASAVRCETCGMTYSEGEPSDQAMHKKFHKNFLSTLKFPGWKREKICYVGDEGSRVIVVSPQDSFATKKVEAICQVVDNDLGFVVERRKLTPDMKVFLYISENQLVIGCCIVQTVSVGYRMIDQKSTDTSTSKSQELLSSPTTPSCCGTQPEPAKCGISRIWVLSSERRKKVATQLLDCVRYHFLIGYALQKEELAFSDPTPDGRRFAAKYTGTPCFLVYNRQKQQ